MDDTEIHKKVEQILFTREEIENRIFQLAKWVNTTYKNSENLLMLSVLKGSIPFLSQLIKDVKVDHAIDFMTVSSWHGKTKSSGQIKIVMDLDSDIKNKDVLIVEDIIDSGKTLQKIIDILKNRQPNSIKIITLINKKIAAKRFIEPDMYGFKINDFFIVGYGLDFEEKLRNLPYIGIFKTEK